MSPSDIERGGGEPEWRGAWLVAYRALSDVAGKGAFFIVTIAAARRLDQTAFGIFALGTTIGWIAALATDFGIQLHAARAVAQRPYDAFRTLAAWGRVRVATTVVAAALLIGGVTLFEVPAPAALAIVLLGTAYLASGLLEFLFHVCRGLGRTDIESTLTLVQRGAALILGLAALWWHPDVRLLGLALLVPAIGTLAYAVPRIAELARRQSSPASARPSVAASVPVRHETASVFAIGAGIVLSALYFRIDLFLIEMWQGAEAVALYNAVFRLVDALRLLPAALLAVALPAMFRTPSHRLSLRLAGLVTSVGIVIAGAVVLLAGWIVPFVYGLNFEPAVPVLRILMLSFPLMCLNYVLTQQLVGWHRHFPWAASCAGALVLNVLVNSELIPRLGIVGAAWATVWTEAFLTVSSGAVLALTSAPRADAHAIPSAVL